MTTGSYRFQYPEASLGNAQWVSAETVGDASAADVNLAISSTPNAGSARSNVVTSWGYNNNGDGTRVVAAEPALAYGFETFYSPSQGNEYMESDLQYESTMGKYWARSRVRLIRKPMHRPLRFKLIPSVISGLMRHSTSGSSRTECTS